ncbi:hypothetical protein H6F96_14655 [Microcoleus sp. FACHB-53]|nr:hypothetical protein [Microcoleus sp. FACHB-53]
MSSQVYAPNVHLFAFHLKKERQTSNSTANSDDEKLLWDKCEKILERFESSKKKFSVEDKEEYRVDLLKDKPDDDDAALPFEGKVYPDNTSLPIAGRAYPLRIHDTYALALNIRRPEEEVQKKTKPVPLSFLGLLNPNGCLMPHEIKSSLGQTLLLTVWYTAEKQWIPWKSQKNRQELRQLADECLREFVPKPLPVPKFNKEGELFKSPIYEYGSFSQLGESCHILVWIYCEPETSENFIDYYNYFINLFCYRHKVIGAYQRSRKIQQIVFQEYKSSEQYIDEILPQVTVNNTLNQDDLDKFKNHLKQIPKKHLEYSRLIRDLEHYRLTIEINAQNYQRELRDIQSQLPGENLSFLETFLSEDCRLFTEQIQADLGYFGHGVGLLEKTLTAIQGRVGIEQAERDRALQNTIQAVGFGIGAAGVVATGVPYLWKQPDKQPETLTPFISVVLLSLVAGLVTWGLVSVVMNSKRLITGVKQRLPHRIGTARNQASLPSSQNPEISPVSQQKEKDRSH